MISMSFFRMLTLSGTACLVALALAVSEAREAPLAPGPLTAAEAAAEDHAKGKEVYAANKCQMCHMIDGAGNKRAPLDGVGSRLSKDDIRKWILTPAEMNPKVKKPNFAKIAAADLTALVDYLASLK
jgi:mono/diheme cytochrome c family protein